MGIVRRRILVLLGAGALAVAAGCDRATARGPTDVTTTSATMRPDARPAHPRTVDAAGFVDNAGRFGNETVRTEMSGMRATETGSPTPTGTPGSGLPIPIEPPTRDIESGERPRPPAMGRTTTAGAPAEVVTGRAAQALCDRENVCGRVGSDAAWGSVDACVSRMRAVVREQLADTGCHDGYEPSAVAACLSAVRLEGCDRRLDGLATLPVCAPRALCFRP